MTKYENLVPVVRGGYIPAMLERHCLNGDTYIMMEEAYGVCTGGKCSYQSFQEDLAEQIELGIIHQEGRYLYLAKNWQYENTVASCLADILQNNKVSCPSFSSVFDSFNGCILSEEQCAAVKSALSHRFSMILGGAGTGKTTIINKIVSERPRGDYILAAPTGKAAKNLTDRTGKLARTVHSVLGISLDECACSPIKWENVSLVVIDEASMLTLELLAGLLSKVRKDCRVVLVGDPEQLLPVGCGNTIPDLLELKVPFVRLNQNFRQEDKANALYHNVVDFKNKHDITGFRFDNSFRLEESMDEDIVAKALVDEAVRRYRLGENIQVLSPYNSKSKLSVQALNKSLQERINPAEKTKRELKTKTLTLRDGDRIIITRNNNSLNCVNGDIGIFRVDDDDPKLPRYHVETDDGRCIKWVGWKGCEYISHAYALTVHKSQGSQYDVVLLPLVDQFYSMLYRNLVYTVISRAKKQVALYGSKYVLNAAMQNVAKPRRTNLVEKTKALLLQVAA